MYRTLDLSARHSPAGTGVSSIDYSYVFGTQRGAGRHDPHVRQQREPEPADLRVVSELLRGVARGA